MNNRYGTNRKAGVGFNHPRVLGGRLQYDWRAYYALVRRIANANKRTPWHVPTSSLVQALREYRA